MTDPICIGCHKRPEDIAEYIEVAEDEPEFYSSPSDYVRQEEGTYNPENGHFLCTDCYCARGMPHSPKGWVAP